MKFEDLDVWKKSARLSVDIYKNLSSLKDFGFKDQITRSGLSVPSNIAEGFERETNRECSRFLTIARGSCGELRTQIFIGIEINYINRELGRDWLGRTSEISAMLTSLIQTKQRFIIEDSGQKPEA